MKQTANYGLNQWDEQDRILRTEFNEDNGKIDAVIKAVDQRITAEAVTAAAAAAALQSAKLEFVHIGTFTANVSNTGNMLIPTPGIHYEDYNFVVLDFMLPKVSGYYSLGANNCQGNCRPLSNSQNQGGFHYGSGGNRQIIMMMPMRLTNVSVATITLCGALCLGSTVPAEQITGFGIGPDNSTFNGPATLTISGMK